MSRNNLIITLIVIVILIALASVTIIFLPRVPQSAELEEIRATIVTEQNDYKMDENGRVKITNDSTKKLCFSSCFPYVLEVKREKGFEGYSYSDFVCETPDLAGECVNSGETKMFEFPFTLANEGVHRIGVRLCMDCVEKGEFKEEDMIYSNEFNLSK